MKYNKLKAFLAGLLSFSMIPAVFAGCGATGGNGNNNSKPPVETVDDGDLTFDNNDNIVYDKVELNLWSVTTGPDADTQDQIINQFNTLYNGMIKVNVKHHSRYELEQLLTTTIDFDKQNAPDMLFSHGSRVNEYVAKDWLLPMEKYMEKAGLMIDRDDYVESLLSATTVNGLVYGLPQDVHSAMIVYRKDILEKNNLPVPTNFAELVSVCDQAVELAQAGSLYIRGENSSRDPETQWRLAPPSVEYNPFPFAFGDMWVHEFLGYTAVAQNGGSFVNSDGYPGFNTREVADGLQLLRELIMPTATSANKHPVTKPLGSQYDVGNAPLRQGTAIFKLLGPWEYQNDLTDYDRLLKDDGGSANIGTMSLSNLFARDNSKEYANKIKGEGHAFMLFSGVQSRTKQCAAAVFADWMVNNASITWAKRGHLPSLKSVERSSAYRNDPAYEAYIKNWGSCSDYIVIQPTPYYSYIDSYFKNCVNKALSEQFKDSALSGIIQKEYDDCVGYIELYS